jgi:hypothetical protein
MAFTTFVVTFLWTMVCLGYYGLTLNSTKLAGDPVLNFFLVFVPDLPLGSEYPFLLQK